MIRDACRHRRGRVNTFRRLRQRLMPPRHPARPLPIGTPSRVVVRETADGTLRVGDIYERKGERQKAIDEYARFVRLWTGCDARLRPLVSLRPPPPAAPRL